MEKGLWDLELQVHGCQEEGSLFAGGLTAPPGVPRPRSPRTLWGPLRQGGAARRLRGAAGPAAGEGRRPGPGPHRRASRLPPSPPASSGFLLKHTIGYILTNTYSHESTNNIKTFNIFVICKTFPLYLCNPPFTPLPTYSFCSRATNLLSVTIG